MKYHMRISATALLFIVLPLLILSKITPVFADCDCSRGTMGNIVGIEYIACGIDVPDSQAVQFTKHTNHYCTDSGEFIKHPTHYSVYETSPTTAAGLANFLVYNGTYRVFKTGSHIIAVSRYFNGTICGIDVTNYAVGQLHEDIITTPYIFPPLGEENNDRDNDGIVDCIDRCPDTYNPFPLPCNDPLSAEATEDKHHGLDEENSREPCLQGELQGNPISILTGNKVEKETDLVFNSPFDGGFVLKRYYNSRSETDSTGGFGWRHNFQHLLTPGYGDDSSLLKIIDGTGRGFYFEDDGTGFFNGLFAESTTIRLNSDNNYQWTRKNGKTYIFEPSNGRLISITDKSGNIQTLSYDVSNRLETVLDVASNRSIRFNYGTNDKISTVEGPVVPAVPDGIWISYAYDANGNLTTVTYADDNNGSTASGFSYGYQDDDPHNLTEKTNFEGTLISSWTYNSDDKAVQNYNKDGNGVTVNYDNPDQVMVTDVYGISATYTIAEITGRRKIIETTYSNGCSTCSEGVKKTDYDPVNGFVVRREYFNGRIDLFENHDENQNPRTTIKAYGTSDEQRNFQTFHPNLSAPLTITTKSVLADAANPDRQKVVILDYDDPAAAGDTDLPNESPTSHIYRRIDQGFTLDETGQAVPYEYITVMTYNSKGQILSVDGSLPGSGDTIQYTYDNTSGDLLSANAPITGVTTFEYDTAGNQIKLIDINTIETVFTYDGRNRLLSAATNGKTSAATYTAAGKVSTVTDRASRTFHYNYDSKGLLSRITNPEDNYITFLYDNNANLIEKSWFSTQGTQTRYKGYDYGDPAANQNLSPGKPWKAIVWNQDNTSDLFTTFSYHHGRVSQVTDPAGGEKAYGYDVLGRLIQETQTLTNIQDAVTLYDYDLHGNLTSVTDANNNRTEYLFDDMGNLVKQLSPDTGSRFFTYDAAGNLITEKANDGSTITYTYDDLGRNLTVEFVDSGQDRHFIYDEHVQGKGRLTGISDASGTYAFYYDTLGNQIQMDKTVDSWLFTASYAYDDAGNVTAITYPDGRVVSYDYSLSGNISQVTTTKDGITRMVADSINYQPFGPVKNLRLGNNLGMQQTFDLQYRPTTIQVDMHLDLSYGYDLSGNIDTITDGLAPDEDLTFGYDLANRLTSASNAADSYAYTYDPVGNRLTETVNSTSKTYEYTAGTNRLITIDEPGTEDIELAYDGNGNINSKGNTAYTWTQDNRLSTVEENSIVTGEYTYNRLGQRTEKITSTQKILYHYDRSGNLIAESLADGTILREYIWLHTQPLAVIIYPDPGLTQEDSDQDGDIDGKDIANSATVDLESFANAFGNQYKQEGEIYFYHNDHLGTPKVLTDESASIVWQASHTPFGEADIITNTVENNIRFPGQYFDGESGLHYNWHRYYDPMTGRYLTPDPIGLAGGINLFVYVRNDPVSKTDPLGLWPPTNPQDNNMINSYSYFNNGGGMPNVDIPWGDYWDAIDGLITNPVSWNILTQGAKNLAKGTKLIIPIGIGMEIFGQILGAEDLSDSTLPTNLKEPKGCKINEYR